MKKPDNYDEISKTEIFEEIVEVGKKNDLISGDLARISSYLTNGEYPILSDTGLTKKIFKEFYES